MSNLTISKISEKVGVDLCIASLFIKIVAYT